MKEIYNLLKRGSVYFNIKIFTCVSVSFKFLLSCSRFATLKYLFLSNSASKDLICAAVNAVRGLFFLSSSLIAPAVFSWISLSALVVEFAPLLLVHASATISVFYSWQYPYFIDEQHKQHVFWNILYKLFRNRIYWLYNDSVKSAIRP